MHCPKCDADISDSYEPDDFSIGVVGGYYCDACDLDVADDCDPLPDDVPLPPLPKGRPLGTPLSELSGQPGRPGYERFKAIARSWGRD